ncbi:MAG: JDVT-CTERM system glutamic-type intramembrane protease, partial [Pseudomonadota bacterium]
VGMHNFQAAPFPNLLNFALVQILLVALPEEFFFRGYFQSAANAIFPGRMRFFGANIGWGLLVTAAVFAFAHSVVLYKWWHFSIFFPALVFGYLRERTGTITVPVLFHAASNILMDWITRSYV